MVTKIAACISIATLLVGCTHGVSSRHADVRVVRPATDADRAALIDRIKSLAGDWEIVDSDGKGSGRTVFAVTSAGSSVREIMFAGDAHEMTNVYHMDGDSLLLTHYCAMGNQPRMRGRAPRSPADPVVFEFDSVTNLAKASDHYMGRMKLTIKDADHITQEWYSFEKGKTLKDRALFSLRRKKS